jgi:tRNA/rRNA methyltransferase
MAALEALPINPGDNLYESQASHAAIDGMLEHLQRALIDIEFLDPKVPKRLMERLASLFARSELSVKEVDILRGIARQIQLKSKA